MAQPESRSLARTAHRTTRAGFGMKNALPHPNPVRSNLSRQLTAGRLHRPNSRAPLSITWKSLVGGSTTTAGDRSASPITRIPATCHHRSRTEGCGGPARLAISAFRKFANLARRRQGVNPFAPFGLGPSLSAGRRALPRWKALPPQPQESPRAGGPSSQS
jgi:hypothetical protein